MPAYSFCYIRPDEHVQSREDYDAPDDLGALMLAQQLCDPEEVEVWQGTRFVARVAVDGTASHVTPSGPHSSEA
jgi:hypothetical protein